MKIVAINTESVPIGTKVTFYFGDPDVDVLSALAHIRATQIGGLTNGTSGSVVEVDGAGEPDGDTAASDAPVGKRRPRGGHVVVAASPLRARTTRVAKEAAAILLTVAAVVLLVALVVGSNPV